MWSDLTQNHNLRKLCKINGKGKWRTTNKPVKYQSISGKVIGRKCKQSKQTRGNHYCESTETTHISRAVLLLFCSITKKNFSHLQ